MFSKSMFKRKSDVLRESEFQCSTEAPLHPPSVNTSFVVVVSTPSAHFHQESKCCEKDSGLRGFMQQTLAKQYFSFIVSLILL